MKGSCQWVCHYVFKIRRLPCVPFGPFVAPLSSSKPNPSQIITQFWIDCPWWGTDCIILQDTQLAALKCSIIMWRSWHMSSRRCWGKEESWSLRGSNLLKQTSLCLRWQGLQLLFPESHWNPPLCVSAMNTIQCNRARKQNQVKISAKLGFFCSGV